MKPDLRYKAFISYSRKDRAVAQWLQRSLESYAVPRSLVGRLTDSGVVPRNIRPIFRDQSELAVSASLGASISEALAQSAFLIVICSPSAARSQWVEQEIATFKRLHGESGILAIIAAGEPFASEMDNPPDAECFPRALRYQITADGEFGDERCEPMAADIRHGGDGRKLALLKLAATLLGVSLDELTRRDAQRRYRQLRFIAAGATSGMIVMGWLTFTAMRATDEARTQRDAAEGLIEFMLSDLRQKLEPVGRLDAMDAVGAKALGYYETQDQSALDADSLSRRARALHLIGEFTGVRGDSQGALQAFLKASASTAALLQLDPADTQRIFDHSQSEYWVGYVAWQRGEYDTARASFQHYLELATRLVQADPSKVAWQQELGFANGSLGTLAFERRQWSEAASAFGRALAIAQALAKADPGNTDLLRQIAVNHSWLSSTYFNQLRMEEAAQQNQAEIATYEQILRQDSQNRTAQWELLIAKRGRAQIALAAGDGASALTELRAAEGTVNELLELEPDSTLSLEQHAALHRDLARVHYHDGHLDDARTALDSALTTTNLLLSRDTSNLPWQLDYLAACELLARIYLDERRYAQAENMLTTIFAGLAGVRGGGTENRQLPLIFGRAHLLRGDLRAAVDDHTEAMASWESALAVLNGPIVTLEPERMTVLLDLLSRMERNAELETLATRIVVTLEEKNYFHPAFVRAGQRLK